MAIPMKQLTEAMTAIAEEKNISVDIVFETIEAALAAAYRKDYGERDQEVRAELDKKTGKVTVFIKKEVVAKEEDVEIPALQMILTEAKKHDKKAKVGGFIELVDTPEDFERRAAQTAKQVLIQRFREAEREMVFSEYKDKEETLVNGVVQRIENDNVFVDLGKAVGILFPSEQVHGERYYIGQRLKVFVVRVEQSTRGPQIILSRNHPGMIKRLFELEVPELDKDIVEIKSIAREAGGRTKIAVHSNQTGVDPVGTFVGQRGTRVQAVMAELGEEKIDIILYDEDPKSFIANALSPAKVIFVELGEADKKAKVKVPEDQLSLAIGKQGQNVRLAAKLTDWNIDILGADEAGVEATAEAAEKTGKGKTRKPRRDFEAEMIEAVESQVGKEGEDTPAEKRTKHEEDVAEKTADLESDEQAGHESTDKGSGEAVTAPEPEETLGETTEEK